MPFEIVPAGTRIDFIGKRRICGALSVALLLLSLVMALPLPFTPGVKLGIDFAGGTEVQVHFDDTGVSEGPIRQVVEGCGISDPSVVRYGRSSEFLIKFKAPTQEQLAETLGNENCPLTESDRQALQGMAEAAEADITGQVQTRLELALARAVGPLRVDRVEFVGPRVGEELRRDGISSLTIACVLILIYVAFRFSTRFAPGAVVALVHDIGITAGVLVLLGVEFDLRVLAALLAILGYSLNDTIIIYDRIRENMEIRTKHDLEDVLNRSVNQTLSRTVLTSGTTMAAVLALLFLGGEVIRPFALAMSIGIVVGTYSSVFIAAPTLLWLEQRARRAEEARGTESQRASRPATGTTKPRTSKPPSKRKQKRAKARA
ncbi:MAG: protein translocase subunit SecF [Myxococcota bacterium]|nr:protein translocase subunit SecF [Myxococcota bacterium]